MRAEYIIHDYHKAFNPMDSHTPTEVALTDPAELKVRVASTDVIAIRWYVNGTELKMPRSTQTIKELGRAPGSYRIMAMAYDSVVDYAFTGNPDLDLVRNEREALMQSAGWLVRITQGGENAFNQQATWMGKNGATWRESLFFGSSAIAPVFLPWHDGEKASRVAVQDKVSSPALTAAGNYVLSGKGTLGVTSGKIMTFLNTQLDITVPLRTEEPLRKTGLGALVLGGDNRISKACLSTTRATTAGIWRMHGAQPPAKAGILSALRASWI